MAYEPYISVETIAAEVWADFTDNEITGDERAMARLEALLTRLLNPPESD